MKSTLLWQLSLMCCYASFSSVALNQHTPAPEAAFCWFGDQSLQNSGLIPEQKGRSLAQSLLEENRYQFPGEADKIDDKVPIIEGYYPTKGRKAFGGRLPLSIKPNHSLPAGVQSVRGSVQHGGLVVLQGGSWLGLPVDGFNHRVGVLYDGKLFNIFLGKHKAKRGPYRKAVERIMKRMSADSRCLSWSPVKRPTQDSKEELGMCIFIQKPMVVNLLQKSIGMNAADETEGVTTLRDFVRFQAQCRVIEEGTEVDLSSIHIYNKTLGVKVKDPSLLQPFSTDYSKLNAKIRATVIGSPLAGGLATPTPRQFFEWKFVGHLPPPLVEYSCGKVIQDIWNAGMAPHLAGRRYNQMGKFPKVLIGDAVTELEDWLHAFQRGPTDSDFSHWSDIIPSSRSLLPPPDSLHMCVGSPLRFSTVETAGPESLAGKLVQWIEWHASYGVTSLTIYISRTVFQNVFPRYHLIKPDPKHVFPTCNEIQQEYALKNSAIPRGNLLLRVTLLYYMCTGNATIRIYDMPEPVLATAHALDQHAMLQDCGSSARYFTKFLSESDLDEFFFVPSAHSLVDVGKSLEVEGVDYARIHWRNLFRPPNPVYNLKMALCGEGASEAPPGQPGFPESFPPRSDSPPGDWKCGLPQTLLAAAEKVALKEPLFFAKDIGDDRGEMGGKWIDVAFNGVYHSMHHLIASTTKEDIIKTLELTKPTHQAFFRPAVMSQKFKPSVSNAAVLHYRDEENPRYTVNETKLEPSTQYSPRRVASFFTARLKDAWRAILSLNGTD